ncbi:zinc uptake transcriptional repressor Zur [Rheinheimera aquimaris]|uniref:Zinc uptake transcriptional repressor Zur n=1 Tax=Rheinheimera aquimaris TaxID=412437 RepID=A0ABN1DQE1_9GAMM|nr:transcriptional repressor [Rheinheimera aquimaris]MCB5213472.1 transcriptional repressor [Rheinheimera aquimaris]
MKASYCVSQAELNRRPSMTKNRKQVMALLQQKNTAMSAYELIAAVQQDYDTTLHPMAAYRALDFLLQMQCVLHLRTINKFIYVENRQPTFWQVLICDKCQQIEKYALSHAVVHPLLQQPNSTFQTRDNHIELHGLCHSCVNTADS